jgi:hypothetical protein
VVSAPVMRRDQRFHRVCPLANRGEPCLALSFAEPAGEASSTVGRLPRQRHLTAQ